MPTLYTKDGASAVFETAAEVQAALATGEWFAPEGGNVAYTTPLTGRTTPMTPEALALTPSGANYGVERGTAGFAEALAGAEHSAYSGIGDQLLGAAEGAGSVLSLGLSDWALDAAGADTKLRAEHTVGRTVGEVAAVVGTALSPFGKGGLAKALTATPAGAISKLASGGKTALARVALASGEGAAYGVGQAVSNIALAEPGMTAEQVISELGQGALLGAALGGVGGGMGEGIRAVGAMRSARAAKVLNFEDGVGKDVIEGLHGAHKTTDDVVKIVQAEREVEQMEYIASGFKDVYDPRVAPKPPVGVLGDAPSPKAFKKLLMLAEREPQKAVAQMSELHKYYEDVAAYAKGSPTAEVKLAEAAEARKVAFESLMSPEAAAQLAEPKTLAAIFSSNVKEAAVLEAGIQLLPDGTPGKDMLQLAAVYKLVGGVGGTKGATRSLGRRIANAIGRRSMAGAFAGAARMTNVVKNASPVVSTAITGGAASSGYEFYNWAQRLFSGRGLKSVMTSKAQAQAVVDGSVNKLATGSPSRRARGMPGLHVVLDKLTGEPDSRKTPQEKFAVVQDRLAKATVAPDATLNAVYELLKPLQEVSEQLADMAEMALGVQLEYLQKIAPKDPGTMMIFGKSSWAPSDRELYEFALGASGVLFPLDTIEAIADGLVPPQAAEALAATNPELFMNFQRQLMARADEVRANSTLNQRITLGLAFKVPLEPTADPRYVAFVQNMHAQKTMEQAAGKAGESDTPEESYSDAQKLLS